MPTRVHARTRARVNVHTHVRVRACARTHACAHAHMCANSCVLPAEVCIASPPAPPSPRYKLVSASDKTLSGDNDPIDVIELGTRQRPVGSITRVKIIGVIAMIDDDETDWKVLTIAMDDDKAVNIQDLVDLDAHMPGVTASLTHWLRMYKTAEGKGENRFGYGGKPQGKAVATRVVEECHEAWRQLLAEKQASGGMKKVASGHNLFTSLAV